MRSEWKKARIGEKSGLITKWAGKLECSVQTLYRYLRIKRARKGISQIENITKYARIVAEIKKRPPGDAGELTTDQAVEIAMANGAIPEEMRTVSISTFDRTARDLELNKKARRISRFQAERPNQLHHVDASTSRYFYVARKLDEGDYMLKLNKRISRQYKNKPTPIGLRPWIYGVTDDHSGLHLARYVAAYGESLIDNLDFLGWAYAKNDDKPFFGIPEHIKGDCGPMMRGDAAKKWLERLGIANDPSPPYAKEGHGKIERPWRTMWQRFEKPFLVEDLKTFEIRLSDLNRRFLNYQNDEYNRRPHRYESNITRLEAWQRINHFGGAVAMPENAVKTAARRYERTVGPDGCFKIDNIIYEVGDLHHAKVYIYEGIFDDKLVVVDQITGQKYEAKPFAPLHYGEYRAYKETPHEKAVKAAQDLTLTNTLYQTPKNQGNIAPFPTRIKETRIIENPMDIDTYSSVAAAMSDFIGISGIVPDKEDREAIKILITRNDLSRQFVRSLAMEVRAENERSMEYG